MPAITRQSAMESYISETEVDTYLPETTPVDQWDWTVYRWQKSGMRPGKWLARQGGWKAGLKEGAMALSDGLRLSFSLEREDFEAGYSACHSCMRGMGEMCYAAYAAAGVGIFLLREQDGTVVARSLGWYDSERFGWRFVKCYGNQHYVLDIILVGLGVVHGYLPEKRTLGKVRVRSTETKSVEIPIWGVDHATSTKYFQRWKFLRTARRNMEIIVTKEWSPWVDY